MSSERNVIKEGYLIKSPPQQKLMAQWHRRYFVLWSSRLMEYYTSHEKKPTDYRKTVDLKNCEDMIAPVPIPNKGFVIKLSVRSGEKIRDYFFECFSESDMNDWVKCLARVCGFTPVDEQDTIDTNDSSPSFQPAPIKRPALRPPLPPPKPSTSFAIDEDEQRMYEEIVTQTTSVDDGSESDDDLVDRPEQHYEDFNVDDSVLYAMNKHPPPLWNPSASPPPLPGPNRPPLPGPPPRKWSKSLEKQAPFEVIEVPGASTSPAPPSKPPRRSPGDEPKIHKRPLPAIPIPRPVSEGRVTQRDAPTNQKVRGSYHGRSKKPVAPPPKPSNIHRSSDNLLSHSAGSGGLKGMGVGINLSNDPKFKGKLQERREEIYSGNEERLLRSQSWHEDSNQLPYEEIEYTGDMDNVPWLNPAVRLGSDENDEGYIDCELTEDGTPQEYIDFETANRLINEDIPLPLPKDSDDHTEKMRKQFISRPPLPIPPRDQNRGQKKVSKVHPKPPSPLKKPKPAPPMMKRSSSIGEMPLSPGFPTTSPPPLPSREVLRAHATPSSRRDNHSIHYNDNEEEFPPPIPRRHPHASDKLRASSPAPATTSIVTSRTPSPDNILPLPPRAKSPANLSPSVHVRNVAPPLPSRVSNRDALPPPPLPNRSISEPFHRGGGAHPVAHISKSAPMSPEDVSNHYSFAENEEEEEEQPIFEPIQFGKRSPTSQNVNGPVPPSRHNPQQPVLPSRSNKPHNFRHQPNTPAAPLPLRKETPLLPGNRPFKDRSKPCPPPVANKPSSQAAKKPPLARKPKPGGGVPKPTQSPTRTPATNESLHHQRPKLTPPKPALKPKPLPPPKPVPGTA